MNTSSELIEKAIAEAKSGNKAGAKKILAQVIRNEPDNAQAWYVLSRVVDEKEQVVYCLNKVLEIMPDNPKVKARLKRIQEDSTPKPSIPAPTAKPKPSIPTHTTKKKGGLDKRIVLGTAGIFGLCIILLGGVCIGINALGLLNPSTPAEKVSQPLIVTETIPVVIFTDTPELKPTNTPFPTETLTPTDIPIPTSTPQQGTFNNPVSIGVGYTFPGLGTFTIIKSLWKSGQTGLAIVEINFVCERPSEQECDTGHFMLDAIGHSGNGYEQEFDTSIPEPWFGSLNPPVYGGGSETGYAGFLITKQEDSLLMRVRLFLGEGEVFFRISQ